jgi:hypothetical protein
MQVTDEWSQVLTEDSQAATDLKHDVISPNLSLARDNIKHVGIDEEVLAKLTVGNNPSVMHPLKGGSYSPLGAALGATHQPNTSAAAAVT